MVLAGRAERGPDRAVGRRWRRDRHGAAGRRRGARAGAGAASGAELRRALLYRAAARRTGQPRGPCQACGGVGCTVAAAGGGHAPGAVPGGRGLRGARGARVHRRGRDAGQPTAHQALLRRAVLQVAPADRGAVRRRAVGAGQQPADRAALQPAARRSASRNCRTSRSPTAWRFADYFRKVSVEGLEQRLARALSRCGRARAPAPALRRAAGVRDRHDPEDGLPRLLPDRQRLHQVGAGPRLSGGPGPRLGRRLAGGLFAVHHRPGPAAIQPAVRALPEPRARVDARLRHRLLPGQSRTRHRLRQGQVRPRRGQPDRHLRHHGRQGRAARRRPCARHGLRPCGQHRQAGAGAAGQAGDAAARARQARPGCHLRAQGGARARAARGRRGRGGRVAVAGDARRRPGAQRRHACRRRAHRAGQDHRLLPAVPAAGQRQRGQPVRQGRCRGHRPGEVRLPRPGHADHPGAGQGLHPRAPAGSARTSTTTRCRSTTPRSTSCSPKARPRPCSSSKAAACRACCARRGRAGWKT